MKRAYGQCLLAAFGTAMFLGCFTRANAQGQLPALGNLTVVKSSSTQYRYQRARGIGFDFVQRQKRFTLTEAIWIRDALDKLPTAYLQKAISSGVTRFYRDARQPQAPLSFLNTVADTDAIAVPPSPWRFIAFADPAFRGGAAGIYRVVVHQLGHCAQWDEGGGIKWGTDFTWISWTGIEPFGLKSYNGFVSEYARTNHREDYAETCMYFWLDPEKVLRVSPLKFDYMLDTVFGTLSPPEAWQDLPAVASVKPIIRSLSDTHDKVGSFVAIKGDYFMGPFDGGYNRVFFNGYSATFVPISRNVLWVWVPDVPAGPVLVTVKTQDGISNAVAFTCDGKPWWMFW